MSFYFLDNPHISIHFPHRGRHIVQTSSSPAPSRFQSTSPTGEDTPVVFHFDFNGYISIHFPHRGRHFGITSLHLSQRISIHFPHRGRHFCSVFHGYCHLYFNPLPPQGKTRPAPSRNSAVVVFQSTSPTGEDTLLQLLLTA